MYSEKRGKESTNGFRYNYQLPLFQEQLVCLCWEPEVLKHGAAFAKPEVGK
jgi:hypothetical protein